ncbi:hypothetical protein [Viridibacillus arvi]|uniref:hypothetical protein n=1 Tax=Viridibacillus arvi TaxID=263475 RepID=UPI0034CE77F4
MVIKTTKDTKDTKSAKVTTLIYMGPTSKLMAKSSTFIGGYPKHVEEHLEAFPALEKLFMPVEKLPDFLEAMADEGSAESVIYRNVSEYLKGVK